METPIGSEKDWHRMNNGGLLSKLLSRTNIVNLPNVTDCDKIVTLNIRGEFSMDKPQILYTVQEMIRYLRDHRDYQIEESEQMIRRYLRQGKIQGIRSSNRKEGWRIPEDEVYRYLVTPIFEGTIYEEDIDDATRIKRLFAEVERLEKQVSELNSENNELLAKLGMDNGLPF